MKLARITVDDGKNVEEISLRDWLMRWEYRSWERHDLIERLRREHSITELYTKLSLVVTGQAHS